MNYRQEYEKWLASPALSEDERNELKAIANDEKEIENRFYGPLEFGTAGLRGTMYVGLHNMNRHVIRWATQGFANVIRAEGEEAMKKGVAICMDCRNHSMEFARAAACVMAGNGITVKLFESLRPTPQTLTQRLGHGNATAYHHHINILGRTLQENITYISTDYVTFQSQFISRFGYPLEYIITKILLQFFCRQIYHK